MRLFVFSTLLILLAFFSYCGNSSSGKTMIETESVDLSQNVQEKKVVEDTLNVDVKFSADTNEIILFANMDRFIRSKDKKCIVKGMNTSLMDAVLMKYIRDEHIDPNRKEKNVTDSVFIDLITDDFSFVRKTLSDLTEYDVLSQREENVDEAFKQIPAYNWYFIKGKFVIKEVKLDIATIEFTGKINQLDAITYHYYGEDAPFNENEFKDVVQVDLMEAVNNLGRMKKFTRHDLEIIDNKNLKYIRNQFFARKGYIFKTEKMSDFFGKKNWYTPRYENISDSLSKTEKYNIEFIKQLEEEVK